MQTANTTYGYGDTFSLNLRSTTFMLPLRKGATSCELTDTFSPRKVAMADEWADSSSIKEEPQQIRNIHSPLCSVLFFRQYLAFIWFFKIFVYVWCFFSWLLQMKTRLTRAVRLNRNHKDVNHKNQNNELKEAKALQLASLSPLPWVTMFTLHVVFWPIVNVQIWIKWALRDLVNTVYKRPHPPCLRETTVHFFYNHKGSPLRKTFWLPTN